MYLRATCTHPGDLLVVLHLAPFVGGLEEGGGGGEGQEREQCDEEHMAHVKLRAAKLLKLVVGEEAPEP